MIGAKCDRILHTASRRISGLNSAHFSPSQIKDTVADWRTELLSEQIVDLVNAHFF